MLDKATGIVIVWLCHMSHIIVMCHTWHCAVALLCPRVTPFLCNAAVVWHSGEEQCDITDWYYWVTLSRHHIVNPHHVSTVQCKGLLLILLSLAMSAVTYGTNKRICQLIPLSQAIKVLDSLVVDSP